MTIDSTIETIIWDFDGTLIDSFGSYHEVLSKVFIKHGLVAPDEKLLREHHHGTLRDSIGDVLQAMEYVVDEPEIEQIFQDFLQLENDMVDNIDDYLFPDAVALAKQAHQAGLYQVVVTNRIHRMDREKTSPRLMIQHSQVKDCINDVICGDDSEHRKPKKEVLVPAFGEHLVKFQNCLVIGDQFVDAEFARNLEGQAILVQRTTAIAHLERLGDWQSFVTIVPTLSQVRVP